MEAAIRLALLAECSQDADRFNLPGAKVEDGFVLVLRSPDVNAIRGNLHLANKIESKFGQKVWFVVWEESDWCFVEGLFYPLGVLSVNLFWLPDGNKQTKAIVAG